jgi:hypothetical protein
MQKSRLLCDLNHNCLSISGLANPKTRRLGQDPRYYFGALKISTIKPFWACQKAAIVKVPSLRITQQATLRMGRNNGSSEAARIERPRHKI